jgi:hypothetical protein
VTPIAATALYGAYASSNAIATYVTALALVSLVSVLGLRSLPSSTTDQSHRQSGVSAAVEGA